MRQNNSYSSQPIYDFETFETMVRTDRAETGGMLKRSEASGGLVTISAGEFSHWLRNTESSLKSGEGTADVPCGSCRGCCRSSMFIHIKPDETQTIQRIPGALLFPAPGLPKGHLLMGYSDKGCCPMLVNGECSIYEQRPQTCRDYDCRVFAATGVSVDQRKQREIADRVRAWTFEYESDESREEHGEVKKAAEFLQKNRDLFPQGSIPSYPIQLAALAVRIYRLFCDMTTKMRSDGPPSDAVIAQEIIRALRAESSE